jgi:two-component system sensor histidine kinase ResE
MLIQADIKSFIAVVISAAIIGSIITWLLLRTRRKKDIPKEADGRENLYLVFSRIDHRLKTAGEVIRGHLHGFSDELPQDAERWRVARRAISEEASEINSLIDRLDLVVRLGMAEQPLVIEPVNVPRLLEDVMVNLGPSADAKNIVLGGVINKAGQDAGYISGDVSALREVFSNLLENSIRHNGPGTEVTAEVTHQDSNLLVRITDNGKGIPQDIFSRLFEKGTKSYHPRMAKGTGTGLYLCKLLVQLHGGQITAKTVEGKSTEFRILLPLRRTQS